MDPDVLVVGAGPVGLTLTALLRAAGVRTLLVEAAGEPSRVSRAVVLDDEALRVLQGVGVRPPGVVHERVLLRMASGRAVTLLQTPARTHLGQPALLSLHQPDLEDALARAAGEVRWGTAFVGVEAGTGGTGPPGVRVRLSERNESPTIVRAGWVVGCDGARSAVRRAAGIELVGSSFREPWTVIDGRPQAPVAASRHVEFVGDPGGPGVTLPLGNGLRRFELLGDRLAELPGALDRWCPEVEIVRAGVYTFHARAASRWRVGRVLLAGDAAHLMPPFAGQGLGSGLRDAANLAWRLCAVVGGGAPEDLLDGYEAERAPHVAAMTRYARLVGGIVATRRRRLAAARDGTLRGLDATPGVGGWLQGGALKPRPARELVPQPVVTKPDGHGVPLDELLGPGWAVLTTSASPARPPALDVLPPGVEEPRRLTLGRDLGSPELERWLRGRGGATLVRPDRAVAG